MDNQKAYTESGERVPYQTVSGTGTSATYSVAFQDAVLRLEITPHIIDEEFIKLQVLIQKDEVDTTRAVSGNPYIVKKKTETTLIARNGETVVISGLSKLRNSLREAGIPGVKDIPGVGWLGKSESKADLKDEFMIFITPTVLADWRQGERQKSFEELEREAAGAKRRESGEGAVREHSGTGGSSTVRLKEMPVESLDGKAPAPEAPRPGYLEDISTEPARPPAAAPAPGPGASGVTIKQMPTAAVSPQVAPAPPPAAAPDAAPDADADSALLNTRPRKPGLGGRR